MAFLLFFGAEIMTGRYLNFSVYANGLFNH